MESVWVLQGLLNEYEDAERNNRIDKICTKNFDERDKIFKIIDYIYSNENLTKYNLIYSNLNSDLRDVFSFIQSNKAKFDKAWLYANIFASYIWKIANKGEPVFLNTLRLKHKKNLNKRWYDISILMFYLRIKNDIVEIIEDLNNEYIIKENVLFNEDSIENNIDADIEYNNYILDLMSDLVDHISSNKNLFLWDLTYWYFKDDLFDIKAFLDSNKKILDFVYENSIYFQHFIKMFDIIINKWGENVIELENEFSRDLSVNDFESIKINDWYYDEMKAELYDLVKNLNSLLQTDKTTKN